MSDKRDAALVCFNEAVRILNKGDEVGREDLHSLSLLATFADSYALLSISTHLDRIATALESKE